MKVAAILLAAVVVAGPAIPYFKYQRPVQAQPNGQRFVAVDEQIWISAGGGRQGRLHRIRRD